MFVAESTDDNSDISLSLLIKYVSLTPEHSNKEMVLLTIKSKSSFDNVTLNSCFFISSIIFLFKMILSVRSMLFSWNKSLIFETYYNSLKVSYATRVVYNLPLKKIKMNFLLNKLYFETRCINYYLF
jgi:hypothetical protein